MVYMWTYDFNTRDISRFNYGSMWIALLIMMWFFCPTDDINKLSGKQDKGDDEDACTAD